MHAKKLRDAVHKDIRLTTPEVAALDTPQMQRLRGIRQLGAAYYVYPGAQHTRFEHCLGTLWMARRIIGHLELDGAFAMPEVHAQAVALAALVHDVTHIPFGHTFEDERRLLERHDRSRERYDCLLADCELGRELNSSEAGRLALRLLEPDTKPPEGAEHLRQIVCGTICADLLDYLKRDNYFCGLSYEFDERVFHYFRVADGRLALTLEQGGYFRPDALTEITNLLRIRYVLSERVYYHHAKMAAGAMISKAIERALELGLTRDDLCRMADDAFIHHLHERFAADPALSDLVEKYRTRRLFKRCYVLSRAIGEENVRRAVQAYHFNREGRRDAAEQAIADALGVPAHQVAVYCAPEDMALKEADVPVIVPGKEVQKLSALNRDEITLLQRQHRALWRLYVFLSPDLTDRLQGAGRACEEVFGYPNELPAERAGGLL